jgi:hypothetical protein
MKGYGSDSACRADATCAQWIPHNQCEDACGNVAPDTRGLAGARGTLQLVVSCWVSVVVDTRVSGKWNGSTLLTLANTITLEYSPLVSTEALAGVCLHCFLCFSLISAFQYGGLSFRSSSIANSG